MSASALRPAQVCRALLATLDAAEGRRKQRKRDQTPDRLGLDAKRQLLERAVHDDPDRKDFERWLMRYTAMAQGSDASAAACAMARTVLDEWRLAQTMPEFAAWLDCGAPSHDRDGQRRID